MKLEPAAVRDCAKTALCKSKTLPAGRWILNSFLYVQLAQQSKKQLYFSYVIPDVT